MEVERLVDVERERQPVPSGGPAARVRGVREAVPVELRDADAGCLIELEAAPGDLECEWVERDREGEAGRLDTEPALGIRSVGRVRDLNQLQVAGNRYAANGSLSGQVERQRLGPSADKRVRADECDLIELELPAHGQEPC